MKLFQKTWVAIAVTAVMIAAAIGIGWSRGQNTPAVAPPTGNAALDESLATSDYVRWILDDAGKLSDKTERQICLYNANWVQRYDSLIVVAVMDGVDGDLYDWAVGTAKEFNLSRYDGVLAIDVSQNAVQLVVGQDYPMSDSEITAYTTNYMADEVNKGNYDAAVLKLFGALNQYYVDNYGLGYLDNTAAAASSSKSEYVRLNAFFRVTAAVAPSSNLSRPFPFFATMPTTSMPSSSDSFSMSTIICRFFASSSRFTARTTRGLTSSVCKSSIRFLSRFVASATTIVASASPKAM